MVPLPLEFEASMRELLGEEEYRAYEESFQKPRVFGLRANLLKWSPRECQEKLGRGLTPIPWIANGFFYEEEMRMAKDPYYYAGLYYLQEPSAMTPASLLPVEPGDRVLDLCAAPGGKSTELGAKLRGRGILFANDISNSRAKALLKNLELFGVGNICVTSETPEKLASIYPEYFDKILIDAPCSGEGMFRKDDGMIKDWMKKGPEYYSPLQKEILNQAILMLKPGGILVYSTCTFSPLENEQVVLHGLKNPDMELLPIPLFEGACDGIGLSGCIRLFPQRINGEGHFIAMLHKKEAAAGAPKKAAVGGPKKATAFSEEKGEAADFLSQVSRAWEPERFLVKRENDQETIYYLPEGFEPVKGLRYLRTGLLLGTVKKGRFEPSQALAMTLSPETFGNSISFSHEDERVIRYLKGETVSLKEGEAPVKGWCLICVDGYALGFAKGNGMSLKNKYYPGWRWM